MTTVRSYEVQHARSGLGAIAYAHTHTHPDARTLTQRSSHSQTRTRTQDARTHHRPLTLPHTHRRILRAVHAASPSRDVVRCLGFRRRGQAKKASRGEARRSCRNSSFPSPSIGWDLPFALLRRCDSAGRTPAAEPDARRLQRCHLLEHARLILALRWPRSNLPVARTEHTHVLDAAAAALRVPGSSVARVRNVPLGRLVNWPTTKDGSPRCSTAFANLHA